MVTHVLTRFDREQFALRRAGTCKLELFSDIYTSRANISSAAAAAAAAAARRAVSVPGTSSARYDLRHRPLKFSADKSHGLPQLSGDCRRAEQMSHPS